MKILKPIIGVIIVTLVTSCITPMPLNQHFYNNKKVGIIIQIDSIGMSKFGGQGLLDMALTPGNRFTEALKKVEPKLNLNDTLKSKITGILKTRNKEFEFIEQKIDYKNIPKFEKPKSDIKFSKLDFRNLKSTFNVDELMIIRVNYGLLVSYYGMIETDKQGYINIGTEIIDLSDNSLLQQDFFLTTAKIKGNWKKGEDFENLKNSIQDAINGSLITLKTKF